MQTSEKTRREAEKKLEADNKNVKFADFDTIIDEQREEDPAIIFTVKNRNGEVVRHVEGPAEAGFHRIAWNLRYPALNAWTPIVEGEEEEEGAGVLVAPGTFSVSMQQRVDGVLTDLGQSQTFDVVSIREPTLPGSTQEQRVVFESQVDELGRASDGTMKAIDRISEELDAVKATLSRSTANPSLYEIADSIQERLLAQRDRLSQNEIPKAILALQKAFDYLTASKEGSGDAPPTAPRDAANPTATWPGKA